ncbi:uncharacterized protein LOC142172633 [Nicotiana tabacum]|uniref:Uncharacterized protein LOC142172633 n=1 Tax=Nicotiana tabacum TaxID=4097 RepID=A0AC58T591_TOBAC
MGDKHHRTAATGSRKEAGPYQKTGESEVVDFLWENIICRFGILKEIACDNGPQLIDAKVTKFLEDLKIKRITSSPYHLSANGQVESMNKIEHRRNSFFLVYSVEALILVEVREPTLRYFQENDESNNEAMLINLELLEERRDLTHVRMEAQKQRMERYYNQRENLHYFKVGDLVLRKVTQNTRELNAGKLGTT